MVDSPQLFRVKLALPRYIGGFHLGTSGNRAVTEALGCFAPVGPCNELVANGIEGPLKQHLDAIELPGDNHVSAVR